LKTRAKSLNIKAKSLKIWANPEKSGQKSRPTFEEKQVKTILWRSHQKNGRQKLQDNFWASLSKNPFHPQKFTCFCTYACYFYVNPNYFVQFLITDLKQNKRNNKKKNR